MRTALSLHIKKMLEEEHLPAPQNSEGPSRLSPLDPHLVCFLCTELYPPTFIFSGRFSEPLSARQYRDLLRSRIYNGVSLHSLADVLATFS